LNNDDYSSKNLPTLRVTTNYRNKNKNKKQKTKNKKQTNKLNKQIKQTNKQTNKSNKLKLIPSASLKYVPRAKLLCWRHL